MDGLGSEVLQAAKLVADAIDRLTEETRLGREYQQTCAAAHINEFNWEQIRAVTQGGIVGASVVPGRFPKS